LEDICLAVIMPFLDDIRVKGPYTDYDSEEVLPGIRKYVFEYI